jgi:hypothetical protein
MTTTTSLPKATKRNSVEICGQLWHVKTNRYWSPDTCGGSMESVLIVTRYSDGKSVTGGCGREKLIAIIAERIEAGVYPESLGYAAAVRKMVAGRK